MKRIHELSMSADDFFKIIEKKNEQINKDVIKCNTDIANEIINFIISALKGVQKHNVRYPLSNKSVSSRVLGCYLEDSGNEKRSFIIVNEDKIEIKLYFNKHEFLPDEELVRRKPFYDALYVNNILSEYGILINSAGNQKDDDIELVTITQSKELLKDYQENNKSDNIQPKLKPNV